MDMYIPIQTHIAQLSPGFYINNLLLTVDRVSIREPVKPVGDPPRDVKEFESVDLYCWDDEVCCLLSVV